MLLNPWSIALCLISVLALCLIAAAGRTALNVLRYWDPASDSNRQIRLENETWLASTLVQNAMGLQVVSLILFTLAADKFSAVINGAMCATGSLLANQYGMPALYIKLAGIFLYGFWIVLHKLDISCDDYPLLRLKFIYLLILLPFLLSDITVQTLYLLNLHPNIITSCCAVVYSSGQGGGMNLLGSLNGSSLVIMFYTAALLLYGLGFVNRKWPSRPILFADGLLWLLFLWLALVAITVVFSSYVYAMPYHHCPFCILKPQYYYIGYLIYLTLFPAVFFGLAAPAVEPFRHRAGLGTVIAAFQRRAGWLSLILLTLFIVTVSWHYVFYKLLGGQT